MPPVTLQDGTQLDPKVVKVMKAIRQIESGGNYNAIGDNGRSKGAYQWHDNHWSDSAATYLGDPNAPMTPANQNKVAYAQIKSYKDQGLQPEEIAARWNGAHKDELGRYTYNNPAYGEKFRAALSQQGGQTYGSVNPAQPQSNNATQDFGGANTTNTQDPGILGAIGNTIGGVVKSVASPIATMLARPIQAGAELLGASPEEVNKISNDLSGGLVAPVPQNFEDVKKDVGRAGETVALGLGPVAGGALFGAGNSVEQGNNILSGQTALQAGVGGLTGAALQAASPLISKGFSAITPKFIKQGIGAVGDAIAPAANAVSDFADKTQILPGPISKAVNAGANTLNALPGKAANVVVDQFGLASGQTRQDALSSVNKALGETGKKSAGVLSKSSDAKLKGLENMAANAEKVKLSDGAPYEPTTANLHQNVEALHQLKQDAYNTWMQAVKDAGGSGVVVDTEPVIKELSDIVASPGNARMAPQAQKIIGEIQSLQGNPIELQKYLESLNNGLRGVFSGGQASIEREVDAKAVKALNEALDNSVIDIESNSLPIREAKDLYSSYKAVEDGLVKKAQQAARATNGGMGGGFNDYINPFNIADALEFFTNPIGAAKGALRIGLLAKAKSAKNPEKILQGVFQTIQNYKGLAGVPVNPGTPGINGVTGGLIKSVFPQSPALVPGQR